MPSFICDWAFLGMYRLPRGLFVYAIYISANDYKIHNVVKQGRWGKKGDDDVSLHINAATTMIRESTMWYDVAVVDSSSNIIIIITKNGLFLRVLSNVRFYTGYGRKGEAKNHNNGSNMVVRDKGVVSKAVHCIT